MPNMDRPMDELDVEPTYGEPTQLEGRYEVDPISGGKRFQGAWLVLDDGKRYIIAYRPVPEHFQFADKRVRVHGRPYMPGRDTQHIQATHLELHTIDLAPGETPYPCPPTELPAPPHVRSAAELAARVGCWVQVVGILEAVWDDPDGYLGQARLRLQDGTEVLARTILESEWAPFRGQTVTVTSRVNHIQGGFALVGSKALCPGEAL